MSQWDDSQDPYNAPYNGDGGGPAAASNNQNGPGSPLWNAVVGIYQTALGRAPENDSVIQQWIDGTGGNLAAIQTGIYATPEAQAWGSRNANQASTPQGTPDPGRTTLGPSTTSVPTGPAPGPSAAAPASTPNVAPSYTPPPAYTPPAPFQYDPFNEPTQQDVLNDPQYQLAFGQGMQAIGAKNAALGTLNTGGTIRDFENFGSTLAASRYDDIFNRRLSSYNTNRANAFDAYKTNYGIGKDAYDTNVTNEYNNPFQYGMQGAQLNQNNSQFAAQLGQNQGQFDSSLEFQKYLQNYRATVSDPWDRQYKLLGLL